MCNTQGGLSMKAKTKATITAAKQQHSKDSNSQRIIATIKGLFLSGRKLTAKQINEITGSNDARKAISTLRSQGWHIVDILLSNRCKLYWLIPDDRQLNIWEEQG